jgi:hypothetical protein
MIRKSTFALAVAFLAAGIAVAPALSQNVKQQANGHGTLDANRQFSFNAQLRADGTVTGQATLMNPEFTGANGHSPYQLQIDISCMKVIGNVAFFGGTTKRTNDPNLVDAVYFSVQDNGEPGKGRDMLSRAFFFDDDPATQGDPQLCQGNQLGDFPMEPITAGNIQVKN